MARNLRGIVLGAAMALGVGLTAPAFGAAGGTDLEIVSQLHLAGQLSIDLANLGADRARDPRVTRLANDMAADHRVADLTVLAYADMKQMDPSFVGRPGAALPAHDALALANIEQSPPSRFDYDFVSDVVANHQAAIDVAVNARRLARDPALKGLIDGNLPMMRRHLAEAEALLRTLPEPLPPATPPLPPAR